MMKKNKIVVLLLLLGTIVAFGCNKNYYSGTGKGSNCGCPSHKGMTGY
jgi:predicted small secreted protein